MFLRRYDVQLLKAAVECQGGIRRDGFRMCADAFGSALAIEQPQPRNTCLADFALIVVKDYKIWLFQMALARSFQERPWDSATPAWVM